MGSPITRRDFLNGAAIGIGSAFAGAWLGDPDRSCWRKVRAAPVPAGADGPARIARRDRSRRSTRMRDGSPSGRRRGSPTGHREDYDLVVVGAGISGLAAAHFFRKARPDARILRARQPRRLRRPRQAQRVRPQRTHLDRLRRHAVDRQPRALQRRRQGLIEELGIDVARYPQVLDCGLYKSLGLRSGVLLRPRDVRRPIWLVAGRRRPARRGVPGRSPAHRRREARPPAAPHRALRSAAGPQPRPRRRRASRA